MKEIEADILIIGGGTAGCYAAAEAKELNPKLKVVILEKGHIERSGCLAAGVNAINAYINPGETVESFVRHVREDAIGLVREDLVKTIAEELNRAVAKVEKWGLAVPKDREGNYERRGRWNIKVYGESLKPILAEAAEKAGAEIYNRVVVTNLLLSNGEAAGAVGFGVRDGEFYVARAKSTIIATGGASGIYKPNTDGSAHHRIWYSPFNTGAGYAMGIRAGAEMTSFEMRFVALRTKDVIAPTGTLALGFGAKQVNARGEEFMGKRFPELGGNSAPTCYRTYGPVLEMKEGRGPCYLDTTHLTAEQVRELKTSYLDMCPSLPLYWAANGIDPGEEPVEIAATEPYITGGHCQAGYWVTVQRETTIPGLYAAGDVAGGAPYKFVSGCWVEGAIAARAAAERAQDIELPAIDEKTLESERKRTFAPLERFARTGRGVTPAEMEERLQRIMDEYAGGASKWYEMDRKSLELALRHVLKLKEQTPLLIARDLHELMLAHEVIDRVDVAEVLVHHLMYREETRWPGFTNRRDFPERDDERWLCFVNSRRNPLTGEIEMIERPYRRMVE